MQAGIQVPRLWWDSSACRELPGQTPGKLVGWSVQEGEERPTGMGSGAAPRHLQGVGLVVVPAYTSSLQTLASGLHGPADDRSECQAGISASPGPEHVDGWYRSWSEQWSCDVGLAQSSV